MRDGERERWKSDPDRTIVQSDAWNRAALIWYVASPLTVTLIVLEFVPDWTWKELSGVMMLAFASGSFVLLLGWVYEMIKYRGR